MDTTTTRPTPADARPFGAEEADASLKGTRRWALGLTVLAAATLLAGLWMVFFYVPTEAEMGVVQRIFYVHVPSAWTAFVAFGIVALCSAGYLWLRDPRLDAIAVSSAELGLLFTTLVLLTGPLWAKVAWGAWWVWEPRLTLTLLLWFIYVGYFMLRGAAENAERGKRFAAILGVVGAVDIPLIHVSVQWWRSQHPKPVVMRPEGAQGRPAHPADAVRVASSVHAPSLRALALPLRGGGVLLAGASPIAWLASSAPRPVSMGTSLCYFPLLACPFTPSFFSYRAVCSSFVLFVSLRFSCFVYFLVFLYLYANSLLCVSSLSLVFSPMLSSLSSPCPLFFLSPGVSLPSCYVFSYMSSFIFSCLSSV